VYVSWLAPTGEVRALDSPISPTRLQHKFEVPDEGTAGKDNLLLDHVIFRLE
jgi:hypothetical protein